MVEVLLYSFQYLVTRDRARADSKPLISLLMKWSLILLLLCAASCRDMTLMPLSSGDGPAVVPPNGSQYVYRYTGSEASGKQVTFLETVSIQTTDRGFVATRRQDSASCISTYEVDSLMVLSDGDLSTICGCRDIYPIQTQSTITITTTSPAKYNGAAYQEQVVSEYDYVGAENLVVDSVSYLCSKLTRTIAIAPVEPIAGVASIHVASTFWYSSKLGYFVKEQGTEEANPGYTFTRLLVSHR